MADEQLKRQGYMNVISGALDAAFADTDARPRQRLLSAKIDFTVKELDCATLVFADPDGRISKAVRNGWQKEAEKVLYQPWAIEIGYYAAPASESTRLVGVPQLEAPEFPESGVPTTTIKVFDISVALKKNSTPGGDPANYYEPLAENPGPLRSAFDAICSFYGLQPDFGLVEPLIARIDNECIIPTLTDFPQLRRPSETAVHFVTHISPEAEGGRGLADFALLWGRTNDLGDSESDLAWLQRMAVTITSLVHDGTLEVASTIARHFDPLLPGEISVSDLGIVTGIRGGKLIFKFAYEFLLENGFAFGIPILDWRCGNNLLLSFSPQIQAASTQTGIAALFSWLFDRDDDEPEDEPPPELTTEMPAGADVGDINVLLTEKRYYFARTFPDGSQATVSSWIDALRRWLDTDIEGSGKALGIPKLMAGQLVGLTGLGWGPNKEIDAKENLEQAFACYNRLYLLQQITHKMDQSGLYTIEFKVKGCSSDGSQKDVIADVMSRIREGVNPSGAGDDLWDILGLGVV